MDNISIYTKSGQAITFIDNDFTRMKEFENWFAGLLDVPCAMTDSNGAKIVIRKDEISYYKIWSN